MKRHQKHKSIFALLLLDRSSGFSLAEVMVGAGILGALSLVVMNLTQNINRSQRSMENKFQVGQIFNQVSNALRDRESCTRTVTGLQRTGLPGAPVDDIFQTVAGVSDSILSRGAVLGGEASGGGAIITVTDIRLISYISGTGAPTNTPEGQVTTTDGAGVATTRDYGSAIIRLTLDRGNTANADNATIQNQLSVGRQTFQRDFRVKVLVNPGASTVVECYAVEESVVEAACEALDGVFSHTDGLCREIKIQEDPSNADSNYAITSRGATLVQEGGLRVGNYPLTEPVPGTGNLVVQNDADIGADTRIVGNLLVQGTGQVDQNMGIGVAPAAGATSPRLIVQGNGLSIGNPAFNTVTDNILSLLNSPNGHILLTKNTNRTSFRVDATTTANNFILMNAGGLERFRVTHEGRVTIPRPAAASSDTNPISALEIGINGGPYFAAFIRNQPANPNNSSDFDIRGTRGDEVATKRWAAAVIYSTLTTDVSNEIANNINTYAANNQLNTIKQMICQTSRVRLTMGAGAEGAAAEAWGVYAGPTCTFSPSHCTGTGAGQRCGVLHVTGINSTGEILATGPTASVRVVNGTSNIHLANTGTITATSTITSNTLVTAPTVSGLGTGANQGVCSANGCATRFGRQFCTGNRIMIGIARGQIVCAGGGSSYSP